MFNVFIITLREGVEIAVVLAIILAYLKQLGQMKETGKVWLGAGAAALLSVLLAVGIFFIASESSMSSLGTLGRRNFHPGFLVSEPMVRLTCYSLLFPMEKIFESYIAKK